ncbi:MAG TPA: hypothetical protein PLG34_02210 [Spirochaetota bacterium]|jgi:hypothetical protein|nr:MAG: hypothetical protein BWX91_02395 [Spirochaetes bacterium ADurb.Bin133]HPY86778.1 hypothetical protein [Spirochaetota bacterium]
MKNILLCFLSFLILIIFSCPVNNDNEENVAQKHVFIKLKFNLVNNTDMTVDYILNDVEIGYKGLENTTDIFVNNEEYLRYVSQSIDEEFKETPVVDFYQSYYDNFNDGNYQGSVIPDSSDDLIYYQNNIIRNPSSVLIRIKFSNEQEKILAGWPKYYYSKLTNVSYYGFAYFFSFDKKIRNYWTENKPCMMFSIDSDLPSGKIQGYLKNTLYSVRVTINSPDNIIFEVLPETGESF